MSRACPVVPGAMAAGKIEGEVMASPALALSPSRGSAAPSTGPLPHRKPCAAAGAAPEQAKPLKEEPMANPRTIAYADLESLAGQEVGVSDWHLIDQNRVNLFAEATGDHQWIHVDVERATKLMGGPIAHGFLTLSLLPKFFETSFEIVQSRMGVNYGLNKVRFMAPVPVGSRLRARMKLLACEAIDNQGQQMTWEVTVEREGAAKPVCVAESIARHYP
jgi:acyl dehydratase